MPVPVPPCSFTLPGNLSLGNYEWQIQTWNPYATNFGPWSVSMSFTVTNVVAPNVAPTFPVPTPGSKR